MTALRNNFEGGPAGTTITTGNSNQTGDNDPFDTAYVGSLCTLQYASAGVDALDRPTAEFVMKTISPAANYTYVLWSSIGTQTQVWTRFYVRFPSVAKITDNSDLNLFSISSGATDMVSAWLRNTANPVVLQIWNAHSGLETNMTTLVTANTWHRIEFRATLSTTVGSADMFYYAGDAADSDTYTETVSQTGQNYGAATGNIFGLGQYHDTQAGSPTVYYSNWELNNTGYPGPAPFRPGKGCPGILPNPYAIHAAMF